MPVLAAHVDVDALDMWGVPDDLRDRVELSAADNVKRLSRRPTAVSEARFDWTRRPGHRAPGMDRRVPGDEDRLASHRDVSHFAK